VIEVAIVASAVGLAAGFGLGTLVSMLRFRSAALELSRSYDAREASLRDRSRYTDDLRDRNEELEAEVRTLRRVLRPPSYRGPS